jgi:hypothetical protein
MRITAQILALGTKPLSKAVGALLLLPEHKEAPIKLGGGSIGAETSGDLIALYGSSDQTQILSDYCDNATNSQPRGRPDRCPPEAAASQRRVCPAHPEPMDNRGAESRGPPPKLVFALHQSRWLGEPSTMRMRMRRPSVSASEAKSSLQR